ncbi:MAG: polysaccharide biosynthesis protein [Ruminococcaceae bacterium]|nr:polysaccharide biosynthesis protein [Oscillospiraceae bacterium]
MRSPIRSKQPAFLSGVSMLTLSALTVKLIGLLYRIPMLRFLGTEGMGYFNTAYEIYALFCVISTAGLPVAMSVLIASLEAEGRGRESERVYRIALALFAGIGAVGTALLWGFSHPLARLLGNPMSAVCMRAIAPTVWLICLSSAFRGFFQGRRNMLPTALSQVIEAGGKLFLGVAFAVYARGREADLPTTAAYAVAGVTVGTALSVLYLAVSKRISDRQEAMPVPSAEGKTPILRGLLMTAVPVTLSAGLVSLTKCIDLALILRRLQSVGYTASEANSLYGCYSTLAIPVFNVLPSLTSSVALAAVPALSAALQKGKEGKTELQRTAISSLGLTMAVAIPAALGVAVFAEDILALLFAGQPEAITQAAPWLSLLGLSIPAACLVTLTGAMLQAAGKANRPIVSMLLGVGCKILLAYVLLGRPDWGMVGAPVSSLVCDTVIVMVNLYFLLRHAPDMLPSARIMVGIFGIPLLLSTGAVATVRLLRGWLGWSDPNPLHTLGTVVSVACLYGAGMLIGIYSYRKHM